MKKLFPLSLVLLAAFFSACEKHPVEHLEIIENKTAAGEPKEGHSATHAEEAEKAHKPNPEHSAH